MFLKNNKTRGKNVINLWRASKRLLSNEERQSQLFSSVASFSATDFSFLYTFSKFFFFFGYLNSHRENREKNCDENIISTRDV